ncbi:hypothetical protein TVAG_328100 [Trichomonas vaginalis G3]|uniref:Initiator binding domain-containing protein n=1 Tax=Trichomonas vaginalis (strain ATCC PRA-98 / G3) TaxID=412133 RepID=A2FWK0_TRIV3|nr:transcription-initiator DNA-binding domain ibd family [Trichomonas vaginalis G3]EAX90710.1 hypothetical protein TVAG_328100 [Trichomonas vaginalis G3]KAI5507477.1 transcription-initiator DNA-binding domain ibd family [Trichomonas vaginalis G3]|eukprot:XP_001303640.1 hypothetical protein [Trichomonas vaginalis G3]
MNQVPAFFDFLSLKDQQYYNRLRAELSSESHKYKKNMRCLTFQTDLESIKRYIYQNDGSEWKRCLVCGICWIGTSIAINTRQLRLLIDKCKSSINGALAKLGYSSEIIRGEGSPELITSIPYLKCNFVEQRQWTIRRRSAMSPFPVYLYSPGLGYHLITPQPSVQQSHPAKMTKKAERVATFGFPKKIEPNCEGCCSSSSSSTSDAPSSPEEKPIEKDEFFLDPCCCCPIEWESVSVNEEMSNWG